VRIIYFLNNFKLVPGINVFIRKEILFSDSWSTILQMV
jgi:hypothetical protein